MNFLLQNPVYLVAKILAFALALPLHEAAHAFVAYRLGDPTGKVYGRLTLNPLRHLDPMGLLMMMFAGVGWAKPVPVNPQNFKSPRRGMALTAAAGPISNLLLAYVSMVLFKVLLYTRPFITVLNSYEGLSGLYGNVVYIIMFFAVINVALAVFNMLPVPPLDGSRVLSVFLPEKQYFAIQKYERYIMVGLMLLLYLGLLDGVLSTLNSGALHILDVSTRYIDWLFALAYR